MKRLILCVMVMLSACVDEQVNAHSSDSTVDLGGDASALSCDHRSHEVYDFQTEIEAPDPCFRVCCGICGLCEIVCS